MTSTILGFDMGIRNLAYCLISHAADGTYKVISWDNIDLLENGVSSQDAKKCAGCGAGAKWIDENNGKKWCNKCAEGKSKKFSEKPALPTIPCGLVVKDLRALAGEKEFPNAKKAKKEELVAWVRGKYLMPWKPAKTGNVSIGVILAAMDKWLDSVLPTFASAGIVRLENQPAMKIPTMKSVQMILYTLLSHRLAREYNWKGSIDFVHASVKTRDKELVDISGSTAAAESVAYKARKRTAEEAVADLLKSDAHWLAYFSGKTKKSDLADAFLMAHRK